MHRTERPKTWARLAAVGLLGGVAAFGAPSVEKGATVGGEVASAGKASGGAKIEAGLAHSTKAAGNEAEAADDPLNHVGTFKPFVLVTIPYDTENYGSGEVMGVSNNVWTSNGSTDNAIAVGYLMDSSDHPQPFMFTAKTDTVTMLDMDSGAYDYGKATSISPDGSHIAGWAHNASSGVTRAVTWDASNSLSISPSLSAGTESHWNAVTDDGVTAGGYSVSSHFESIVDDSGISYPESGSEGNATGVNASVKAVGSYLNSTANHIHAYRWDSSTGNHDLHPSNHGDESGANCIGASNYIGGWVSNSNDDHVPSLWTPIGLTNVFQCTILGTGNDTSAEVVAINANDEMLINRIDQYAGIALWSYHTGANGWIDDATTLDEDGALSRPTLILKPNADDFVSDGRCLNDDLWIGGSYLIGGEGDPQPCLIIPYDIDNNGEPDYRDIVDGGRENGTGEHLLDLGGFEWLLDVSENIPLVSGGMRVGLNRPGYADHETPKIEDTQIVRLALGLNNPSYVTGTIGDDEFYVNGIMAEGTSQCDPFETGINWWYTDGLQGNPVGREIILMLRSNLDNTDPTRDYLPNHLSQGVTKEGILTDLHFFSYKFCRCVDWMQLGNESFSTSNDANDYFGDGGYRVTLDEIGCGSGSTFYTFEQLATGGITCVNAAIDAVEAWQYEQLWAILRGSALAGRPLRMIGPAITAAAVVNGYDQGSNDDHWEEIQKTMIWCKDYQVWFDLHMRYKAVSEVDDTLSKFYGGINHSWDYYELHALCTEMAPVVDKDGNWWTGGADDLYDEYINCDQGLDLWSDYIHDPNGNDGWEDVQFDTTGFALGDVASALNYKEFTVLCYGTTLQSSDAQPIYDLAALRAQSICSQYFDQQTNPEQFSPLKSAFKTDVTDVYHIEGFDPHGDECDACGN